MGVGGRFAWSRPWVSALLQGLVDPLVLAGARALAALPGLLLAGAIALVPSIGFSLFPKAGTPQFLVRVESAEGASLAETDRAVRFVEDTLAENLLLGDYRPGDTIHATREEGKEHLTFRAERATAPISDAAPSETAPSA